MLKVEGASSADLTVPPAAKNQAGLASPNKSVLCQYPTPRGTPTHLARVLFGEQGRSFQLCSEISVEHSSDEEDSQDAPRKLKSVEIELCEVHQQISNATQCLYSSLVTITALKPSLYRALQSSGNLKNRWKKMIIL